MAVLVLHRGGFRDGLIFEVAQEPRAGSALMYRASQLARLPRAVYRILAETATLPNGEVARIAMLLVEEPG